MNLLMFNYGMETSRKLGAINLKKRIAMSKFT
jgi:hypothetical protein